MCIELRRVSATKIPCGKLLRILGSCAEMLLLHFPSFTIGRCLEVTVGSELENQLQPAVPYSPCDMRPLSPMPTHVITVSAPKNPPRYWNCCYLRKILEMNSKSISSNYSLIQLYFCSVQCLYIKNEGKWRKKLGFMLIKIAEGINYSQT